MSDEKAWQEEPDTTVSIERGGAASPTVETVGKMLWLEGFAYPRERGRDGRMHYAVVTRVNVEAVLTNLYKVQTPALHVLRWLRSVGLIKYAPAISTSTGPMTFQYTCANPARDKEPKTIEDVDELIGVIAKVRSMLGAPPPEPDEDDDPAHTPAKEGA